VETRRRKRLRAAAITLAALCVLIGAGWYLSRPKPVKVVVARVDTGPVEATVANTRAGTVKACRRAGLSPLTGGLVADLEVHDGQRVKAGDLLLSLWNDDLKARLALDEAQAESARAQADQQCLMAEEAARQAARQAALKQQGIAAEDQYDKANTQAKAQAAACSGAKAQVRVADATTQVTRADLARTRLTAPFAGVVAEVNTELFEFVTPSPVGVPTPPAVDLIDDSCPYVSAPIDEVDAPKIRAGQPVRVTVDAVPGKSFPGTVTRVAPYVLDVEKQARTVEIEVAFDAPADVPWLLAGQTADVEVILERRDGVLRVPTAAVLEGNRVLALENGELVERTFTHGVANWSYTEVLSGLPAGTQVVTSLERAGVAAGVPAVAEETAPPPAP
jgi:HlyD family secretion protein